MQKEISVLVVDEAGRIEPFTDGLQARGFRVSQARNGIEALGILGETEPSLIILELALGCFDDWRLLKAIRGCSDVPIVGLVDSETVTRINEGLERGIDDYVSRSVGFVELDLRIRLVVSHSGIRRRGSVSGERRLGDERRKLPLGRRGAERHNVALAEDLPCIAAGPFRIDDENKIVTVEGQERSLSPKEYILLKLLVSKPGRTVSREEIIASLWPESNRATISDVQQYVHLLRGKVEKNSKKPLWIKTVTGFGYRLAVDDSK